MFCATSAEGYAACCEAIAELDLRDELSRVSAPTLVIGGAQDPAIPLEHQRTIRDAVSGAKLEIIDDAAHLPSIEHPELVSRLIATHLGVAA